MTHGSWVIEKIPGARQQSFKTLEILLIDLERITEDVNSEYCWQENLIISVNKNDWNLF